MNIEINEYGEIVHRGYTRDDCESLIRDYENDYEKYGDESYRLEKEHWEQNLHIIEEMEYQQSKNN
jgi:hypothetical protein